MQPWFPLTFIKLRTMMLCTCCISPHSSPTEALIPRVDQVHQNQLWEAVLDPRWPSLGSRERGRWQWLYSSPGHLQGHSWVHSALLRLSSQAQFPHCYGGGPRSVHAWQCLDCPGQGGGNSVGATRSQDTWPTVSVLICCIAIYMYIYIGPRVKWSILERP